MKMAVGPAHGYMDRVVELEKAEFAGNQDATPDRRIAVLQRDLELVYRIC